MEFDEFEKDGHTYYKEKSHFSYKRLICYLVTIAVLAIDIYLGVQIWM